MHYQQFSLDISECFWNTSTNVVFLLDQSADMTEAGFDAAIEGLTYTLQQILNRDTNNRVHVALVTYGETITGHRLLSDHSSKDKLLPYIQTLTLGNQQCSRSGNQCQNETLSDALGYLKDVIFDSPYLAGGTESRNIVVILTHGKTAFSDLVTTKLQELRKSAPYIYAIATSSDAKIDYISSLVEDPSSVYFVKFQETPLNLDALMGEIFYSSCSLSYDF